MERLLKTETKDRFVEALEKLISGKVKCVLDNRFGRISGTDKARTFASSVSGLYSCESDMQNVIANRDNAFLDRREEFSLRKRRK